MFFSLSLSPENGFIFAGGRSSLFGWRTHADASTGSATVRRASEVSDSTTSCSGPLSRGTFSGTASAQQTTKLRSSATNPPPTDLFSWSRQFPDVQCTHLVSVLVGIGIRVKFWQRKFPKSEPDDRSQCDCGCRELRFWVSCRGCNVKYV